MGRMIKAALAAVFAVVFFVLASCTASSGPDETAMLNAQVHGWIETNLTDRDAYRFYMTVKTYTQYGAKEYPQSTSYYVVTVLKNKQIAEIRSVGTVTFYNGGDLYELMQEDTQEFTYENRVTYLAIDGDMLCMYLPTDDGGYRLKGIRSQTFSQTVLALMRCEYVDASSRCIGAEEDVHAAIPYTYVSWEITPDETYRTLYALTGNDGTNGGQTITAEIVCELENDTLWATFDNTEELYQLVVDCFAENEDTENNPSRAVVTLHFGTDRYDVTDFSVPTV